jgi:membrane-bound metal-dependent hydrolase YbcI (DUF457 family)
MPFPVAHSLTGLTIAILSNRFPTKNFWYEALLLALLAILPDLDFIVVILTGEIMLHRAFSHSITAALMAGAFTSLWYLGKLDRRTWLLYSAVILSHPILDLITSPQSSIGVMLFWPFSESRFVAGFMQYPFHDWTNYHGLELIGRLAYISMLEFIFYTPVLLFAISIKRVWITYFGENLKTTPAK